MSFGTLLRRTVLDLALALFIGVVGASITIYLTFPGGRDAVLLQGLRSVGVPLSALGLPSPEDEAARTTAYALFATCEEMPSDDQELVALLREETGLRDVTVERMQPQQRLNEDTSRIRLNNEVDFPCVLLTGIGPSSTEQPKIPWEELGYRLSPVSQPTWIADTEPLLGIILDGSLELIYLGWFQFSLALLGLVRILRDRRRKVLDAELTLTRADGTVERYKRVR